MHFDIDKPQTPVVDLFPRAETNPYYIVAPSYVRTSAGIRVLHTLGHMLNSRGYYAYIASPKCGPYHLNRHLTPDAIQSHFDRKLTPIVLYPEVMCGNPYGAPCVVRFLGNFPGFLGGDKTFPDNEIIFGYSAELLQGLDKRHQNNVLFLPASDINIFHPPRKPAQRKGACYYAGKFKSVHGGKTFPITDGAVEIRRDPPGVQTQEEIAEIFWRSEVFYCYENSALSLEAVLCGCPTVLLPNKHFKTIIARDEVGRYGMAWGTDPKEVELAKSTVHLAYPNYLEQINTFSKQLDHFISVTQEAAKKTEYREIIKKVVLPYEPTEYFLLHEAEREIRGEAIVSIPTKQLQKPKHPIVVALLVARQVAAEVGFSGLARKVVKALREGGWRILKARAENIYRRMTAPPI